MQKTNGYLTVALFFKFVLISGYKQFSFAKLCALNLFEIAGHYDPFKTSLDRPLKDISSSFRGRSFLFLNRRPCK